MNRNVLSMRRSPRPRGRRRYRSDQARQGYENHGIVDCYGLPLAVSMHATNHHEITLVQLSFEFYVLEAEPENRIGDCAYDSDKLDGELHQEGIEMISPHRRTRMKPETQDGQRLRRYERRWMVGRFFAWLQWQCRLRVRLEYYAENFLWFAQLATIGIPLRQF